MIESRLEKQLQKRIENGNLRTLKVTKGLIDFYSNDYLGLARNKKLIEQVESEYNSFKKLSLGSTGSRLLSGNTEYAIKLEEKLSKIFKSESALLFNSGYTANSALISSVTTKRDLILYDELVHASMIEGYRLSFADRRSFKHNDLKDLEKKLKNTDKEVFVLLESVYSMDGDNAHLKEMVDLCSFYKANVILDEAHSTGVYGKNGSGLACEAEIEDKIFARVYTFGKGMGCHGACVVGNKILTEYLVNFARGFIYTTAMPLHSMVTINNAFDFITENEKLQGDLQRRIKFYKCLVKDVANSYFEIIESDSAIQAIKIPGNKNCRKLADNLIKNGYDVRPILSPTVAEGEERLRICLHTYNTEEEINTLVYKIKNCLIEH